MRSSRREGGRCRYPRERWNSVVNKAPLTARANRIIGGCAPGAYLGHIQQRHGIADDRMDGILASHAASLALHRANDCDAFLRTRAGALLDLVERTTGRTISGRDSDETVGAFGGPLPPRAAP